MQDVLKMLEEAANKNGFAIRVTTDGTEVGALYGTFELFYCGNNTEEALRHPPANATAIFYDLAPVTDFLTSLAPFPRKRISEREKLEAYLAK